MADESFDHWSELEETTDSEQVSPNSILLTGNPPSSGGYIYASVFCKMDGSQNAAVPGGWTKGYHVLTVQENSPGQKAGLKAFFDFIVAVGNQRLDKDNDTLKEILEQHIERPLEVTVYNIKSQTVRRTQFTPSQHWGGQGLLGISLWFRSFYAANRNIGHVLDVHPNSPASIAGLRANTDYIVLDKAGNLFALVQANEGKPLTLYVYNLETDGVREVTLTPNREWGGGGSLGCKIAFGCLHRIPVSVDRSAPKPLVIGESAEPQSSASMVATPQMTPIHIPAPNVPTSKVQPIFTSSIASSTNAVPCLAPSLINVYSAADASQSAAPKSIARNDFSQQSVTSSAASAIATSISSGVPPPFHVTAVPPATVSVQPQLQSQVPTTANVVITTSGMVPPTFYTPAQANVPVPPMPGGPMNLEGGISGLQSTYAPSYGLESMKRSLDKIVDLLQELVDGQKQLAVGQKQLAVGQKQLAVGQKQLIDGFCKLEDTLGIAMMTMEGNFRSLDSRLALLLPNFEVGSPTPSPASFRFGYKLLAARLLRGPVNGKRR